MSDKIFKHQIRVAATDIDAMNHVNNVVYLQYIQDVAQAHWESVVSADITSQLTWVARRHEIDYLKPAFLGDTLTVKTWVEAFTGVTSLRHCEIYKDNQLITKSKTTWVAINPQTSKPQRVSAEVVMLFL
jgi:acyl-CoA thioester hydrolase